MKPQGDILAAAALYLVTGCALLLAWLRPATKAERVNKEGGTVFLGAGLMHRGYSLVQALVRGLASAGISPDLITWSSLLLGLASGVAVGFGSLGLAAWLLALSGLGDMLDGAVARLRGVASSGGAVLDSVLDRYVECFFLGGLLVWFEGKTWCQLLCLAALLGSFMVTYSTAKAEALGIAPPRGWMKRPERMVWLIYGSAAAALAGAADFSPMSVMLVVLGVVTLASHLSALWRLCALHKAAGKS